MNSKNISKRKWYGNWDSEQLIISLFFTIRAPLKIPQPQHSISHGMNFNIDNTILFNFGDCSQESPLNSNFFPPFWESVKLQEVIYHFNLRSSKGKRCIAINAIQNATTTI